VALLSFLSSLVVAVAAVAAVSAFWSGGTFPNMMYSSERRGRAIMNKGQIAMFYHFHVSLLYELLVCIM